MKLMYFIAGFIVGAAVGCIATKKYIDAQNDNYVDDSFWEDEDMGEFSRINHDDGIINISNEDVGMGDIVDVNGSECEIYTPTPKDKEEIKRRLKRNWEGTTNYAGMYRTDDGYTSRKLAEGSHPLDQGEFGEENPEDEEYNQEATDVEKEVEEMLSDYKDVQNNKYKKPKIISDEVYSSLPQTVDHQVLYFYSYDETVTDEDENIIEDYERFIGDSLTKYNFIDSEESIIFVMNYEYNTAYEIQKVYASWSDSH